MQQKNLRLEGGHQILPDPAVTREGYLRVIDRSGKDYVLPTAYFVTVEPPLRAAKTLALSA